MEAGSRPVDPSHREDMGSGRDRPDASPDGVDSGPGQTGILLSSCGLCLALCLALVVVGSGTGVVVADSGNGVDTPPELVGGEKINTTAVAVYFADENGMNASSIGASDFLLSDGEVASVDVSTENGNATVLLSLDGPIDSDELVVGIEPGSDIRNVNGTQIDTDGETVSTTITGMDGVPPRVIGTEVTDAKGEPARIAFTFDERLSGIYVDITGPENETLDIEDFENVASNRYVAEYSPPENGEYSVSLRNVTDRAGNTARTSIIRTIEANETSPRAVIGLDFGESAGLNVTFDASQSTGSVVEYIWEFGDGTTGTGQQVTHEFAPGTYSVTLRVTDQHGNTDLDGIELDLTDGIDSDEVADENATGDGPAVIVNRDGPTATSTAIVSVTGAVTGESVGIGSTDGDGEPLVVSETFTLDGVAVTLHENRSFSLGLSATGPGSVADTEREGVKAIGGFTVANDLADPDVSTVEFAFSIDGDDLESLDVAPEDVELQREHNGSWESLETSLVSSDHEQFRYEAVSLGFSRFAVVAVEDSDEEEQEGNDGSDDHDQSNDSDVTDDEGSDGESESDGADTSEGSESESEHDLDVGDDVEVVDVRLNQSSIPPGEAIRIEATIENQGDEMADFLAELGVDGEVVDTQEVPQIPAGEDLPARFTEKFDETGTYTISVSGTESEQPLTVEEESGPFGVLDFLPLGFLPLGLLRTVLTFVAAPLLVVVLVLKSVAFYYGY